MMARVPQDHDIDNQSIDLDSLLRSPSSQPASAHQSPSESKFRSPISPIDDLDQLLQLVGDATRNEDPIPRAYSSNTTCTIPRISIDQQLLTADWPVRVLDQIVRQLQLAGILCQVQCIALSSNLRVRRFHQRQSVPQNRKQESDAAAYETRWNGLATDAALSQTPLCYGLQDTTVSSPRLIHEIAADEGWSVILSIPMKLPNNGGYLVVQVASAYTDPEQNKFLSQLFRSDWMQALNHLYRTWELAQAGLRWQGLRDQAGHLLHHRKLLCSILLGIAFVLAWIPIPYRPTRQCTLQATHRHFVACPIEGRLLEAFVRPGEEVHAGQLLARMEDIQIQRELAGAEAAMESAIKKRDLALANENTSDLRLAQLEYKQNKLKVDSLRDRLKELEVFSPIDGIILQGDWHGNNGRPVSFGQTLFEIGSLENMTAEIQLTSEDIPWVKVGSNTLLKSPASGLQSFRGKIERIEPQATTRNEEAVFLAEVQLANTDRNYRPGMEIDANIDAGWHSIGWVLFRKPYRWLINQWVW